MVVNEVGIASIRFQEMIWGNEFAEILIEFELFARDRVDEGVNKLEKCADEPVDWGTGS